jgi:NAD(P)-dependent dehydrogenase (short-subunit alcohol dehydrogenase family)
MKVALITAAGRGIGAGVAHELHQRGYQLGLLSPSESASKDQSLSQRICPAW